MEIVIDKLLKKIDCSSEGLFFNPKKINERIIT